MGQGWGDNGDCYATHYATLWGYETKTGTSPNNLTLYIEKKKLTKKKFLEKIILAKNRRERNSPLSLFLAVYIIMPMFGHRYIQIYCQQIWIYRIHKHAFSVLDFVC